MKPILFGSSMVRAILDSRKTVTRRVVKFSRGCNPAWSGYIPDGTTLYGGNNIPAAKAPYKPGDILWVRETWNCLPIPEPLRGTSKTYWYKADGAEPRDKWRPSIHMPREAARIFLRVTGVRVERLQEIDDDGVVAEGLEIGCYFDELWNSTIKPVDRPAYGWDANPWVGGIGVEKKCSKRERSCAKCRKTGLWKNCLRKLNGWMKRGHSNAADQL